MKKAHSVLWLILAILVTFVVLALPARAAQRKNSCKGNQSAAPLCCRVVTRGYRPGHWQTREDALAVMNALVWTGPDDKPGYKWDERPTPTPKLCPAPKRQSSGKDK